MPNQSYENTFYASLFSRPGAAYKTVVKWSYYNQAIDTSDGQPHGNSRKHGDASLATQTAAIDALIAEGQRRGLSNHDIALVLAIARVESGFNPDAAAGTTSASGLGQFTNDTRKTGQYDVSKRFNLEYGAMELVDHFLALKARAAAKGKDESYIYKYHHDGMYSADGGPGLALSLKEVMPTVASIEKMLNIQQGIVLPTFNDLNPFSSTGLGNFSTEPEAQSGLPAGLVRLLRDVIPLASAQQVRGWRDPLVLDLDGDGQLSTLSVEDGAHFDFDGNGFREATGWVAPTDGLLVRDLNGNGVIDSGAELFGDQTRLPSGAIASSAFEALAALDSNSDGKIDANDTAWSELRVWRDDDADGSVDEGELLSMAEAGIAFLSTAHSSTSVTDPSGNRLVQQGTFTRTDGSTGKSGGFLFDRDAASSLPVDWIPESAAVAALPDIEGMGSVYSLRQAMMRDATLTTAVSALVASTDYRTMRAQFEEVLHRWVGASGISAGARGPNIDARQLRVIEAFSGETFAGIDGPNPNNGAAPLLQDAYQKLLDGLYAQFLAQGPLKSVWDLVTFEWSDGASSLVPNFSAAIPAVKALLGSQPTAAVQLLYEFSKSSRLFGLTGSSNFAAFKAAFAGSPFGYDQAVEAGLAGFVLAVGSNGVDTLNLASRGIVYGLDGGDNVNGSSGDDSLYGGAGADILSGGDGDDLLEGGDGDDILDGGTGADILRGGADNDILGGTNAYDSGSNGSNFWPATKAGNVYEGGTGNDTLRGTVFADLYLFNLGDGQDTISEIETNGAPAGQVDVLRFGPGISPADVKVSRVGMDLVFSHVNGTDKVTVKNWYSTKGSVQYQVERVEFADGTVWRNAELTEQGLIVSGGAGNDILTGVGNYLNVIHGGGGNDNITGGTGDDLLYGDAGDDIMFGGDGNDVLEGGDGNDTLDGGTGADILRGGAGDDILGGGNAYDSGNNGGYFWTTTKAGNTYEGGTGNDTLRGTVFADLCLFNLGDGQDTISEVETNGGPAGQVDVLRFGAGIQPADIKVGRVGADLVLSHLNGQDKVTIRNWYSTKGSVQNQIERVEFADGTVWVNTVLTEQGLTVQGTAGNDILQGVGNYTNVIYGGAGNDSINGGTGDDFLYGGAGDDNIFGGDGNELLEGGDGNDTLDGGTGADILRGGAGDDILGGGNAYDSGNNGGYFWSSTKAGNTYEGGTGNDTLRGTVYADLYLFNLGDGQDTISEIETNGGPAGQLDVLRFGQGIAPADIVVTRSGADLVFSHSNGLDKVTVKNWYSTKGSTQNQVERIEFADGTVWLSAALTELGLTLNGTPGNDVLQGVGNYANVIYSGAGNDSITGGIGDDFLYGGAGDDNMYGGDGSDLLEGGDGNDILDGGTGADILRGGAGDDVLGGGNAFDSGNNSGYFYSATKAGNTYEGGAGNDTLRGTVYADLYLFNLGDGQDTLTETEAAGAPTGQIDVLRFGAGIAPADIVSSRSGADLVLAHVNGQDKVTIKNWFTSQGSTQYQVEQVQFADGTVWSAADLTVAGLIVNGTAGNDNLVGVINSSNTLYGLAGNDTLTGGNLADILVGGAGSDTLYGGGGDDDYRYVLGDGYDTVSDSGGAADVIRMDGLDMSVVHYWRQGNDLSIDVGTGQGMLVKNHFLSGNANRIETFFLNGVSMSSNDMALLAQPKP